MSAPAKNGEDKVHHDGDHGKYMDYKNAKLQEQFASNAAAVVRSNLFNGICVFVNGFTTPSHDQIKRIMAENGGRFENYYSRSIVTYIICTNLADAKVKQFERERSPTPVIRPEWITQSLAANRLLPIDDFLLWQLKGGPGQRSLKEAFSVASEAPQAVYPQQQRAALATSLPPPPPLSLQPQQQQPQQQQQQHMLRADTNNPIIQNNNYSSTDLSTAQRIAAQMRSECDTLRLPPRSSKEDPNFIESFYRASRLHFIGSWKARLEALMASPVAGNAPRPAPYVLGGGGGGGGKRTIIHLDLDCFFASVAEAGHPEFKGKPLAVCHSNSARGSGEVSSANYEARKYGITASMYMAKAKELCPELIVVPYEFDKYEKVSEQVYRILLKYSSAVQPISCDEAFLDVTGLGESAQSVAASIRNDVFSTTGCTASAGIGPNMMLARIATKKAKPNGQFTLTATTALPFLAELDLSDLPGVGWATKRKLEERGLRTVADLHASSKTILKTEIGVNAGALLWDFAHGRDSRRVEPPKPRQSVGAEVNWGVRFETPEDPANFLSSLAAEVSSRMEQAGVRGRTITLKMKRRKPGSDEPIKFLGHGECDNGSRSVTLAVATAAAEDLQREAVMMLRALRVPFDQIRGLGLTVTRLEAVESGAIQSARNGGRASPGGGRSMMMMTRLMPPAAATVEEEGVETTKQTAQQQSSDVVAHAAAVMTTTEDSEAGWESDSDGGGDGGGGAILKKLKTAPAATAAAVSPSSSPFQRMMMKQTDTTLSPSPSPSPSGRGIKRKSPSGGGSGGKRGKQISLLKLMPPPPCRNIFQHHHQHQHHSHNGVEDEDEEGVRSVLAQRSGDGENGMSVRDQLLAKYDGLSLTQIDGEDMASLPWQVQRELISRLPRSRRAAAAAVVVAMNTCNSRNEAAVLVVDNKDKEYDRVADGVVADSCIEPLPALSQVDASVLDALPLQMRRELEAAYGIKSRKKGISSASSSPHRQSGNPKKFLTHHHHHAPSTSKSGPSSSKVRRIDAFVVPKEGPPPPPPLGGKSRKLPNITFSQIDPGVLHELPQDLQDEVMRQLQPFPKKKGTAQRQKAEEAATVAEEVTRQRRELEEMQAAQVAGSSDEEDGARIVQLRQRKEDFPQAVQMLLEMGELFSSSSSSSSSSILNSGGGTDADSSMVVIDAILTAISAAVAEAAAEAGASAQQRISHNYDDDGGDDDGNNNNNCSLPPTQPLEQDDAAYYAALCTSSKKESSDDDDNAELVLQAVTAAILHIGKRCIAQNLECTRRLLLCVRRLGQQHACFEGCAHGLVEKLQARVTQRYGWPLALNSSSSSSVE